VLFGLLKYLKYHGGLLSYLVADGKVVEVIAPLCRVKVFVANKII